MKRRKLIKGTDWTRLSDSLSPGDVFTSRGGAEYTVTAVDVDGLNNKTNTTKENNMSDKAKKIMSEIMSILRANNGAANLATILGATEGTTARVRDAVMELRDAGAVSYSPNRRLNTRTVITAC